VHAQPRLVVEEQLLAVLAVLSGWQLLESFLAPAELGEEVRALPVGPREWPCSRPTRSRAEVAAGLLVPLRAEGFPLGRTWHSVWLRHLKLAPSAEAFRQYVCSGDSRHQSAPSLTSAQ
jgi:hypothetical protein